MRVPTNRQSVGGGRPRSVLWNQTKDRGPRIFKLPANPVARGDGDSTWVPQRFFGSFFHSMTDVFRNLGDDVSCLLAGLLCGPTGLVCSRSCATSSFLRRHVHPLGAIFQSTAGFLDRFFCDMASVSCCFIDIGPRRGRKSWSKQTCAVWSLLRQAGH